MSFLVVRNPEFNRLDCGLPLISRHLRSWLRSLATPRCRWALGAQSLCGIPKKNRYRFTSPGFDYADIQLTETTHRYGWNYAPEAGNNDLVGRPISALAQIDMLGFDFAEILSNIAQRIIQSDRPTQVHISITLNGVELKTVSGMTDTKQILGGQVTLNAGQGLVRSSQITKANYKSGIVRDQPSAFVRRVKSRAVLNITRDSPHRDIDFLEN